MLLGDYQSDVNLKNTTLKTLPRVAKVDEHGDSTKQKSKILQIFSCASTAC